VKKISILVGALAIWVPFAHVHGIPAECADKNHCIEEATCNYKLKKSTPQCNPLDKYNIMATLYRCVCEYDFSGDNPCKGKEPTNPPLTLCPSYRFISLEQSLDVSTSAKHCEEEFEKHCASACSKATPFENCFYCDQCNKTATPTAEQVIKR
jgi:hypothetical protein